MRNIYGIIILCIHLKNDRVLKYNYLDYILYIFYFIFIFI